MHIFARKPERKRPLGRTRHWWVDDIKMNVRDIRLGSLGWVVLDQNRDQ
jgi:hypothetical protein